MTEYDRGFREGWTAALDYLKPAPAVLMEHRDLIPEGREISRSFMRGTTDNGPKRKRKLSGWQKYVKANSKKPRFRYKSGAKKGRINFKALGIAWRKTPAGKKSRR